MLNRIFPIERIKILPHTRVVLLLLFCLQGARAQNTNLTVRPLSLKECIRIALEHNLDVKIERYNSEIARYDLNLAYSYYEPALNGSGTHQWAFTPAAPGSTNVTGATSSENSFASGIAGTLPTGLSYNLGGNVSNTKTTDFLGSSVNSQGSASIQLQQPLLKNLWIDAARLNIQVNKKLLKISELGLRQQIMNTVTGVELAYYDLRLALQNVTVQEQALKLAEQLLSANRQRVEQGVLAPQDEKQAESQVASQRAVLLDAQRALAAQQNVLKGLLSDKMAEWQDVTIEPSDEISAPQQTFSRQESWRKGLALRPDLLQAQLDLERLGYVLKFNRNQLFPQLDLTGSYGYSGAEREYSGVFADLRRGNGPFYSYGAVMTIPLGNRAARSNFKISKAEQQQALVKLQRLEQNIMLQIDNAVQLAQTDQERVGTTREARQFADAALQAEQAKFENGKSTSFFVLQFQRDLTAARSAEIQALADYNKALALLALDEGSALERDNLTMEVK
jgi:outer membrane protein TolC